MTNDEILKIPPQDLDILIAKEKGWKNSPFSNFSYQMRPPWVGEFGKVENIPTWSGSIEHAWELLEDLRRWLGEAGIYGATEDGYWVCYWLNNNMVDYTLTKAETAPIAICRAWLMWKNFTRDIAFS